MIFDIDMGKCDYLIVLCGIWHCLNDIMCEFSLYLDNRKNAFRIVCGWILNAINLCGICTESALPKQIFNIC